MTAGITPAHLAGTDLLEVLTGLSGDAVVVFDAAGTVTAANEAAVTVFGPDLVGRAAAEVWAPEAVVHVLAGERVPAAVEVYAGRRTVTEAAPLHSADGEVAGGLIRARPDNAQDSPAQDSPAAATRAEASEQVVRVFHASAMPTAITDMAGRHLRVNQAFCDLFGYSEAELLALDIYDVSPPDEAEASADSLSRLQESASSRVRVKRLLRSDGTLRWGEVVTTPVSAPESGETELIVQIRDVTQSLEDRQELLEQQRRLDVSQEAGRVGTWEVDLRERRVAWSPQNFRLHLRDPQEPLPTWEEYAAALAPEELAVMTEAIFGRSGDFEFEFEYSLACEQHARTLLARGRHTPGPDGGPGTIAGTTLDVTEERATVRALAAAEARFRRAFDTSLIGMVVMDAEGRAVQTNEALARILGTPREQLLGVTSEQITHPEDMAAHRQAIARIRAGEADSYVLQKRYRHADGHWVWVEVAGAPMDDDGSEYVVQVRDITESRRQQQKLQYLADHDPLTGVLNRRAFDREVVKHLARVAAFPHQHAGALLVLDLDNFKHQNDSFGHAFGDALLVAVAGAIKAQVGADGEVARIGGDEFAVLLTGASVPEASETAKAVLEAIGRAVNELPGDPESPVGASLGLAIPAADDELDTLLQRADARMYDMKAQR